MTHKELQQILAKAKNERRGGAPHDDWVSRNRDILLMQVRNTTDSKTEVTLLDGARHFISVFLPTERVLATARAFAVALLMFGTVFGGGLASVIAYRDTTPGDMTYSLKLVIEKAQVMLAPNDAYKVRLHAEFADRRLDEAAKLAEGPEDGRRLAVDVLESFNDELVQLREGLLELKTVDPKGVSLAAKLLDRKMVAYQQVLKGVVRSLPYDVRPRALTVVDRVEGLSLQAMAVLVEQNLAGDINASSQMVSDRIEDRLDQAEARLTVAAEKKDKQVDGLGLPRGEEQENRTGKVQHHQHFVAGKMAICKHAHNRRKHTSKRHCAQRQPCQCVTCFKDIQISGQRHPEDCEHHVLQEHHGA